MNVGSEDVLPAARELRTPLTSVRGSVNCTPRQLFPASIDGPERRENAGPRRWEPAFGKEVRLARRQGQLLWVSPRCANRGELALAGNADSRGIEVDGPVPVFKVSGPIRRDLHRRRSC